MVHSKRIVKLLLSLMTSVMFCGNVFALPPQSFHYQAFLKDDAGLPANTIENVTFRLYDASVGGVLLWSDTLSISIADGVLSVELGTLANPLPESSMENQLWLGIEFSNNGEEAPRKALHSVTNVFQAQNAASVGGSTEAQIQDRITGSCPTGQSIRTINDDGSVVCEIDSNTLYNGNDFALSNQPCTVGMVVTGVNAAGGFTCSSAVIVNAADITNNDSDLSVHTANILNPHNVTATQVGVLSSSDLDSHENNASAHHSRYTDSDALAAIKAADGPGSGLNADSLDGLSVASFLRSNTSDSYTSGTLSFNSGTTLVLNGTVKVGSASSTDNDPIYFDDGASEYFRWAETPHRFEFTDDLLVSGALTVGPTDGVGFGYNQMRNTTSDNPVSNDISSRGDLFIGYDLEVGGEIYLDRILYMNGNIASGNDGDQSIYFYDSDDRQGQYFRWNDVEGRFDLSTHLKIDGNLTADGGLYTYSDLHVAGKSYFDITQSTSFPFNVDGTRNCNLVGGDCHWVSVNSSCASGKVIVGGGCKCINVTSGNNDCHITDSMAIDSNTWGCAAMSPGSGAQLVVTLMCARLAL